MNRLHRFVAEKSGAAAILAALAMPIVVGGLGLGAEAGYRYYNERLLQHAVDFAAHAGAVRLSRGDTPAKIEAAALNVAVNSGFEPDTRSDDILVNVPPQGGSYAGHAAAVEVYLRETRPRLLSAIFSDEPVQIEVRAVAAAKAAGRPGCILALSKNDPAASRAFQVSGSTNIDLVGCSVHSNSSNPTDSFYQSSSASFLRTECVSTVGGAQAVNLTLTGCPSVIQNAPLAMDPYWTLPEPDPAELNALPCHAKGVGTPAKPLTVVPTETLSSGYPVRRYCGGLDAKGQVTFSPGLYVVEGGTLTSSGTDAALLKNDPNASYPSGITFYFRNGGTAKLSGNSTLDLHAPETGPYSGILFYGGRSQVGVSHSIAGAQASVLQGAVYMPASHLTFSGNSAGSSGCTQIIADTVTLTGTSALKVDCTAAGTEEILIGQVFSVVE